METKLERWGKSLAVRIPKPLVDRAKLHAGDLLEIEVISEGRVELRRSTKTPTMAQTISQITPENRIAEVSAGSEVGKEIVEW
jgi:antitoxin MazE